MSDDVKKNSAGSIITTALIFGLAYAIVRYHVAGPVPWKDFPFFILNKGISLSAFVLLTCNFAFGPLKNPRSGRSTFPRSSRPSRRRIGR